MRAKRRGHIRQHGAGWVVVLPNGHDPITGKRRQRWLSGYKSQKEAERALTAAQAGMDRGEPLEQAPTRLTFGRFLTGMWLPHLADRVETGNLRASTFTYYEVAVTKHLLDELGQFRLRELGTAHLEHHYAQLLRSGLGARRVKAVHITVGAALNFAKRQRLIARNPAAEVESLPTASGEQRPCWSPAETVTFLRATEFDRLSA